MDSPEIITLKSPAKINLHLRVLHKRADGYHEIATFFHAIDLSDEMDFRLEERGIHLETSGHPVPSGEDNLAYRAAAILMEEYRPGKGVHITIRKRIPVAAGLGGGSSNAAAALSALNRLWNLKLKREKLFEHAASLGSDVPFFLSGPAALGRGRGEILSEVPPLGGIPLLLVIPRFQVTAAWAYSNLNLRLTKPVDDISMIQSLAGKEKIEHWASLLCNDLEPAVIERHPIIEQIKTELKSEGAQAVLMSGSGPAVFGLFKEESRARRAADALRDIERTIILAQTLSESEKMGDPLSVP